MKPYRIALFLALLAALAASFWPMPDAEAPEADFAAPVRRDRAASATPAGPNPVGAATTGPRLTPEPLADLFPGLVADDTEAQEAETIAAPDTEAVPVMPPMPFQYLGRWTEAGKEKLFLTRDEHLIETRVGEVIDGVWQVRQSQENSLTVVYLPLEQVTVLRIAP